LTQAWLEQRERSNDPALRFLVWLALGLGRPAGRLLL
jgi:predicted LPLAT superfamily acyltransferase